VIDISRQSQYHNNTVIQEETKDKTVYACMNINLPHRDRILTLSVIEYRIICTGIETLHKYKKYDVVLV
jgi:hypothetical protein